VSDEEIVQAGRDQSPAAEAMTIGKGLNNDRAFMDLAVGGSIEDVVSLA
jgi:hypothetical protein